MKTLQSIVWGIIIGSIIGLSARAIAGPPEQTAIEAAPVKYLVAGFAEDKDGIHPDCFTIELSQPADEKAGLEYLCEFYKHGHPGTTSFTIFNVQTFPLQ